MKLNRTELANQSQWHKAGFHLPAFDLTVVAKNTRSNPTWIHFGAGNIFRAFPATLQQRLLDSGATDSGVIVAEGHDYKIIDAVFTPFDNLGVTVTLKPDGTLKKTVVASMFEALKADIAHPDFQRLKAIFRAPSLQIVSFTITEKGYSLLGPDAKTAPAVLADFKTGPIAATSYMGKIAALLHERYIAGKHPLAMVSMDNYSHNGDKLYESIQRFAREWLDAGRTDKGFLAYVENQSAVSFPWTMIDKITPRPDAGVKTLLMEAGLADAAERVTGRGTHIAPFVNAEQAEYLVIEDSFPNGRPPWEREGVIFTDRETVDKVERMKVCTCLNSLHLALAIFGCMLSYDRINEEMKDPDLRGLVEIIGYREGLPVVVNPGIIEPRAFLDEVLRERFPNPFVPDTPQRIALDISQKFSTRFGETIKAYVARDDLEVGDLRLVPLVVAGWCRYLLGIDDEGNPFAISPDPRFGELQKHLAGLKVGDSGPFHDRLRPILSDTAIFGIDLYAARLGECIEGYFAELMAGPGAVRRTLHKYVAAESPSP